MSEGETKKCPKCGEKMERKKVMGYGPASIELYETEGSLLTRKTEKINAFACQRCGYIELYKQKKE